MSGLVRSGLGRSGLGKSILEKGGCGEGESQGHPNQQSCFLPLSGVTFRSV
jgi:hypothetical protein